MEENCKISHTEELYIIVIAYSSLKENNKLFATQISGEYTSSLQTLTYGKRK